MCPLPVRCCVGMRHCHPAVRAVDLVYGSRGPLCLQATANALSHGSQSRQSTQGTLSVLSNSSDLKPEQSKKNSPEMVCPLCNLTPVRSPVPGARRTSHTLPSIRFTPRVSAYLRRKLA